MAGRPNSSTAISGYVQGLREAKAAFQALPEITRDRLLNATTKTVEMIAFHAKMRLLASPSIRTRSLYNAIAWRVTKTNGRGRVGVTSGQTRMVVGGKRIRVKGIVIAGRGGSASTAAGAKVIRPSRYAHLVELGTRHSKAEPFMLPAAESQKDPYLRRCQAEGTAIERDVSKIGMRTL